jgi:chaperone required for assembly of F1-ATPase
MRDVFEKIFDRRAPDPAAAARRGLRPPLRQRFYARASVDDAQEGFAVLLDGKPVRTPGRRPLAAPTAALAEAIAAEWNAQEEFVEPMKMPLTRLANSIIDGVVDAPRPVAENIAQYFASDLVFYRAEGPQALVERQARHWDPIVTWARVALGAHFILGQGIMFVDQPEAALVAVRSAIPEDAWRLGAVSSVTTLTGSALLALALLRGRLSVEEAWAAAHVDEDWNMDFWGRDDRAMERRAARLAELQAAGDVLRLTPAE